jgi:hypothetical protein
MTPAAAPPPSRPSRYATLLKLASGGMASVWVGTVRGGLGFRQLVAIKKPHPHLVETAERASCSPRRRSRRRSTTRTVDVRDVEVAGDEVSLVMDYVEGASLSEILGRLQSKGGRLPPCRAHLPRRARRSPRGPRTIAARPRDRDVSPQNVLVPMDRARRRRGQVSEERPLDHHGPARLAYMSPEYLPSLDRRLDRPRSRGVVSFGGPTTRTPSRTCSASRRARWGRSCPRPPPSTRSSPPPPVGAVSAPDRREPPRRVRRRAGAVRRRAFSTPRNNSGKACS